MKKYVLSALAAFTLIGSASAADMAVTARPLATPAFSWTGFYIGGQVGNTWGKSDFEFSPRGAWLPADIAQLSGDGAARLHMANQSNGVQAGYNWQLNQFVLGVEADIQYMGLRTTDTFTQNGPIAAAVNVPYVFTQTTSSDWLATVRGRLGFAVDRVLFFGTGGLAIADSRTSDTLTFPNLPLTSTGSRSGAIYGWTAGGGIEWAFAPNWSLKGEYLYVQLDRQTTEMSSFNNGTLLQSYSDRLTLNVGRVGVNYHF